MPVSAKIEAAETRVGAVDRAWLPGRGEGATIETTLVELVALACEWSDDATEIDDWVDALVREGDVHLTGVGPGRN
jgi:hypothetical protein